MFIPNDRTYLRKKLQWVVTMGIKCTHPSSNSQTKCFFFFYIIVFSKFELKQGFTWTLNPFLRPQWFIIELIAGIPYPPPQRFPYPVARSGLFITWRKLRSDILPHRMWTRLLLKINSSSMGSRWGIKCRRRISYFSSGEINHTQRGKLKCKDLIRELMADYRFHLNRNISV